MAIQRHIKIFRYLSCVYLNVMEKTGYLKDLPRVMWYLLEESKDYAEPYVQAKDE